MSKLNAEAQTLTIPAGTKIIKQKAFFNNLNLKKVIFPNGLKKILDDAFNGCENLIEIKIPETVTEIGARTFARCSALKNIELPNSLKKIGAHAFDLNCKNSVKINLPQKVKFLGECFLSNFENLVIPENLENFVVKDKMIFTKNMKILVCCFSSEEKIIIPSGVKICLPYSFNKIPAKEIIFPDSVTDFKIFGCENLKKIKFPEKIRRLKSYSIESCTNLEQIELPKSLRKIEKEAFSMCQSLCKIKIFEKTKCAKNFFVDCNENFNVEIRKSDV